jgi:uncharacterized protein YbaR (Trm112 family)
MRVSKKICELECPKCHKKWAKLRYDFEKEVRASDVTVIAGAKKRLKNGDALSCSLCGHEYTNWDIILAIHASGAV